MQTGARFALAFASAATAILLGFGVIALGSEERELLFAARRETATLAWSARISVENALRDDQTLDVQELVQRVEVVHPGVDLAVRLAGGSKQLVGSEVKPTDDVVDGILRRSTASGQEVVQRLGGGPTSRLIHALALTDEERAVIGAIAVVRPLVDVEGDLAAERRSLVTLGFAAVIIMTALALLLSHLTIVAPLRRLMRAMQQLSAGDFQASLPLERRDEIGAAARAFQGMRVELAAAREQMRAEAELRRSLQRRLERADKLSTIGQLAAGLAHEIGTPLHVLAGRADDLAQRAHDPDEARRVSGIIVEQSSRIARIVDRLLAVARSKEPGVSPVDVRAMVDAVVDLLFTEAQRRGVSLELEAEVGLPHAVANADQVQQVALNLVRNALQATPAGGHVIVRLQSALFEPSSGQAAEPSIALEVEDTGEGIDPEALARIFEPFFSTRREEGTGLGLSVVRSIVDHHGGDIRVTSAVGVGTTVTVHLPVRGPHRAAPDARGGTDAHA